MPWYEHALHILHGTDLIIVVSLQKDSNAAYFYIHRQSINSLRVVYHFANHARKRIPYYVATSVRSGNQILAAATQGDCPTVVVTK